MYIHIRGSRLLSRETGAPILIAPVLCRSFIYCPHRWLWKALSSMYISFSLISCIWSDMWHTSCMSETRARRGAARPVSTRPQPLYEYIMRFRKAFRKKNITDKRRCFVRKCRRQYLTMSFYGNTRDVNKKSIIVLTKMWGRTPMF